MSCGIAGHLRTVPERSMDCYEMQVTVEELRNRMGLHWTSRIVGASFQSGDVDGRGDTVVLLIQRQAEGVE